MGLPQTPDLGKNIDRIAITRTVAANPTIGVHRRLRLQWMMSTTLFQPMAPIFMMLAVARAVQIYAGVIAVRTHMKALGVRPKVIHVAHRLTGASCPATTDTLIGSDAHSRLKMI